MFFARPLCRLASRRSLVPAIAHPTPRSTNVQVHAVRAYRAYNYQRFNTTKSLFLRWTQSQTFYYQVTGLGAGAGGLYVYNLETVPVSLRRRFNIVSPDRERLLGQSLYQQTLEQYADQILPASHPSHQLVERVLQRLIPHAGLSEREEWEVHVIQDPQENAFVVPGGKVFVYTGILKVCQGEEGLAAVLGHEIAHNQAHHAAERMSRSMLLMTGAYVVSFLLGFVDTQLTGMAVDLAFLRPNGRAQESEADHIGLIMMAKACYDPRAALGLWQRMEQSEQNRGAPPQFLSTHPSVHNRIDKIQEWLPVAETARDESGCGQTWGYAQQFRQALKAQ